MLIVLVKTYKMEKLTMECRFLAWVSEYKPDQVSVVVLSNLLCKYWNGDKEPLFAKSKELIESECYKLAPLFRHCFIYIGINEEFMSWQN